MIYKNIQTKRNKRYWYKNIILLLFMFFSFYGYSQVPVLNNDNVPVILDNAPRDPEPPVIPPPGPPKPSLIAKGVLNIDVIHKELFIIYNDCIDNTNDAFAGVEPEDTEDTTHDHIHEGDVTLKAKSDWRCSGGIGWAGTDWCNDVEMKFDKNCTINEFAVTDVEGFFNCEINNEWYVQLDNYFHYELDFGFGISRDLYQTAEIRVYCECDYEDGWGGNYLGGPRGKIKVVQLPPNETYGPAGHWESILPLARKAVLKGLRDQYSDQVDEMQHIIDVVGLSGSPCSSLGIDGDSSVPLALRNIIWDIPQPLPVMNIQD